MAKGKNQAGQRMLPGTRPAPQVCRQVLLVCSGCGYRLRTTRRWLARGLPRCACRSRTRSNSTFVVEGGIEHVI